MRVVEAVLLFSIIDNYMIQFYYYIYMNSVLIEYCVYKIFSIPLFCELFEVFYG